MGTAFAYIAGMFTCALPARYRRLQSIQPTTFRGAAILSGIVQFQIAILILVVRYIEFFNRQVGFLGRTVFENNRRVNFSPDVIRGMGFVASTEYLLNPLSLLLLYIALEGAVRSVGALVAGEPLSMLPLFFIGWVQTQIEDFRAKRAMGPLICDEIIVGDGTQFDIRILSCRPKDWNRYITVRFEGEFYQMFKEETGDLPRRFIYNLRKNPIGRLVVVIREYQPVGPLVETSV